MIKSRSFEAAVIGAGPAGVASVATLLSKIKSILWIDPDFTAGRLNTFYQVPSNTKVSLFVQYAKNCPVDTTRLSSTLKGMEQNKGCELRLAAELVKDLTNSLLKEYPEKLTTIHGHCMKLTQLDNTNGWGLTLDNGNVLRAHRVILATGSHPKEGPQLTDFSGTLLNPEDLLKPSLIPQLVTPQDVIGVVGSSHTAILILKNLMTSVNKGRVINFYRHGLKYAEYFPDGRIKFDNTGLKGEAAEWAKSHLIDGEGDCHQGRIKRVALPIQSSWVPQCNKLVWAIGYDRNSLPEIITKDNIEIIVGTHNSDHQLLEIRTKSPINGLYGIGIAFPERVIDLSGDPEEAVGLWKFMKCAQRIFNPETW